MDSSSANEHRDRLLATLAELEASVETPCIPGELEQWIDAVDDAFQRLKPFLDRQIATFHPQQFDDIGEEDEELFRRVEQMREEDASIDRQAARLGERMTKLKTAAANIEPDEAKLRTAFEGFVEAALDWIIQVRTQEQAIRTWLLEAFTRDRGDVD